MYQARLLYRHLPHWSSLPHLLRHICMGDGKRGDRSHFIAYARQRKHLIDTTRTRGITGTISEPVEAPDASQN